MRILYILNTLATGGTERQVVTLAARLQSRGHTVEIVSLRAPAAQEFLSQVPVHRLGIRKDPFTLSRAIVRGVRVLRVFRPDVVVANNFHGNLLARVLRIFVPRAALVSVIHNVYEGGTLRMLALRLTDGLSDASVAVCRAAAEIAVQRHVVQAGKCSAIPNAVDCSRFTPDAERRAQARAQSALHDEFVWLAVGRLAPAKNYTALLRTFAHVCVHAPHARLWIAGNGNEDYAENLRRTAHELNLDERVRWLGMARDVAALLDAADGFVLASAWEGMPMALAEAMAMEKPIVATDVGGVRELAGDCAGLVIPGEAARLADAMLRTMRATPEARLELGRAARERVVQHFSLEQTTARWEALFQRLLRARAGRIVHG